MDNRSGLCVTLEVHQAVGKTETSAAIDALDKLKERGFKPKTLGAAGRRQSRVNGYQNREFVKGCRERGVSPHCAQIEGLDAPTTKRGSYQASLIVRRRIEQIFG